MAKRDQLKIVDEDFKEQEPEQAQALGPCPPPPENISFQAQLEWIESAPQFHEAGLLHGFFKSMFENFCSSQGSVREARAMLLVDGTVINGKLHPQANNEINHMKEARAMGNQLNLILEEHKNREIKLRELALAEKLAKSPGEDENSKWKEKRGLLA